MVASSVDPPIKQRILPDFELSDVFHIPAFHPVTVKCLKSKIPNTCMVFA